MALVRVYCGVATAELAPWLTVAVVDDSGRLVDMRHVSDDPTGYAYLVALLADRSAGQCPVAVDRPEHIVGQLLAAANRPLTVVDEMVARDVADRFADESSYEEMQAPASQRRAVGLARALQAGALYATPVSPSWELEELKPVLAAHAALVAGRQASAVALREVLRELYPAALRAYLDPAELIPLTVLEAFPEPGMIASGQGVQQLVAQLAASGLTDAATANNAVAALRVAVDESRGRSNPALAPAVAAAVGQAVAAVRACDAAAESLVACLVERFAGVPQQQQHPAAAPVSPAMPRQPIEEPAWGGAAPAFHAIPSPRAEPAYPSVDAGYVAVAAAGGRANGFAARDSGLEHAGYEHSSRGAHEQPGLDQGGRGYEQGGYEQGGFERSGRGAHEQAPGYDQPGFPQPGFEQPGRVDGYAGRAAGTATPYGQGTHANGNAPANGHASVNGHGASNGNGAPRPGGWEQQFGPAPTSPAPRAYAPETLSYSNDPLTAPLGSAPQAPAPWQQAPASTDEDLLIFSEANGNSVWFAHSEDDTLTWTNLASDEGWRAAEHLTQPNSGPETTAGLPRRVPQANLVPGSVSLGQSERMPRIVRDARRIAAHTDGYFRGWRRGQQVGGFAVGQRDRAAWEFNREQRARQGAARLS